jgi:hypothetical protein
LLSEAKANPLFTLDLNAKLVRASELSHWHGSIVLSHTRLQKSMIQSFLMHRSITMTEKEIERAVERRMNMLDRHLLLGNINQAQYEQLIMDLDNWSKEEYAKLRRMS